MFRKFRQSPYAKAAVLILVCGGLLIIFNNWITKNRISIGFENINNTLAPIYIGGILAFILCPVYICKRTLRLVSCPSMKTISLP